jgi:hypothetical protein
VTLPLSPWDTKRAASSLVAEDASGRGSITSISFNVPPPAPASEGTKFAALPRDAVPSLPTLLGALRGVPVSLGVAAPGGGELAYDATFVEFTMSALWAQRPSA